MKPHYTDKEVRRLAVAYTSPDMVHDPMTYILEDLLLARKENNVLKKKLERSKSHTTESSNSTTKVNLTLQDVM